MALALAPHCLQIHEIASKYRSFGRLQVRVNGIPDRYENGPCPRGSGCGRLILVIITIIFSWHLRGLGLGLGCTSSVRDVTNAGHLGMSLCWSNVCMGDSLLRDRMFLLPMTSILKVAEDLGSIPSNHMVVTIIYDSSSTPSNVLFWPPWALSLHVEYKHVGKLIHVKIDTYLHMCI